jgi:hypothetical protein
LCQVGCMMSAAVSLQRWTSRRRPKHEAMNSHCGVDEAVWCVGAFWV